MSDTHQNTTDEMDSEQVTSSWVKPELICITEDATAGKVTFFVETALSGGAS